MDEKKKIILVADDEPDIREIISYNLKKEGYEVHTAKDGNDAFEKATMLQPALIILDVMMPFMSGTDVCRKLRGNALFKNTFIIMLTALSNDASHIKGFESGADDYLSKPISPNVLVSRINAFFRRMNDEHNKVFSFPGFIIDPEQYTVTVKDQQVILAKKEFELLYLLASKPGRVFLRNEIFSRVWGNEVIVGDRTIDVHIRKIRQKLNIDCITTVKGVGYKFEL